MDQNGKVQDDQIRAQSIVDNSRDAIISKTLDGIITSWNSSAEKMFGYPAEEVIGKSISIIFPPELKSELPKLLNSVKSGKVISNYDSVRQRKDGTRIAVSVSLSPIKTEAGDIIGISVIDRDITERKKAEARIKELNDIRTKFIDIIAHQLRTPIGAVNWNLESILNGDYGKLEDIQYKFLQATHEASLKVTQRIHDLLTAMDIEEDRVTFETREMALDNLVGAVVNTMAYKCKLKKVSCQYIHPENELPVMQGDSEKIRSVITKLMENALMYTNEQGSIIAKLELVGDAERFEVKDTGIGIPKPEQHRVFSRFFRASNASTMQPDAFGLGLFIAKSFVEQHGGKLGFESAEGKGSTFWFELPLKNRIVSPLEKSPSLDVVT